MDEAERDRYRKRAGKPLERCGQRERYRLWAILQAIRHRGSWDDYSDGTKEPPVDAIWGGEDADRTFLKFVCLSYRWGGFMEAVLNSWEVMVTFEQAASQADRNFERFREICAAKYPALSAYAEDPDLFQVLLSRPQVAHPRPPDFITEMF